MKPTLCFLNPLLLALPSLVFADAESMNFSTRTEIREALAAKRFEKYPDLPPQVVDRAVDSSLSLLTRFDDLPRHQALEDRLVAGALLWTESMQPSAFSGEQPEGTEIVPSITQAVDGTRALLSEMTPEEYIARLDRLKTHADSSMATIDRVLREELASHDTLELCVEFLPPELLTAHQWLAKETSTCNRAADAGDTILDAYYAAQVCRASQRMEMALQGIYLNALFAGQFIQKMDQHPMTMADYEAGCREFIHQRFDTLPHAGIGTMEVELIYFPLTEFSLGILTPETLPRKMVIVPPGQTGCQAGTIVWNHPMSRIAFPSQ